MGIILAIVGGLIIVFSSTLYKKKEKGIKENKPNP